MTGEEIAVTVTSTFVFINPASLLTLEPKTCSFRGHLIFLLASESRNTTYGFSKYGAGHEEVQKEQHSKTKQ